MNRLRASARSLLLGLIVGHMGKKMEGESADSHCADEKMKVEGKEEIFTRHLHGKRSCSK